MLNKLMIIAGLALPLSAVAVAQQTRAELVHKMNANTVPADQLDPGFTKAAPFAQKLVNQALAKHPERLACAIHAKPEGRRYMIVASNFGRIGKYDDDGDMRTMNSDKPTRSVNKAGTIYEVQDVLYDASGKTIGALSILFKYKEGDSKEALDKIADNTRDNIKRQLPTGDKLFK